MKKGFIAFLFIVISLYSKAQITFQKVVEGASTFRGVSTHQTHDGGYVIAGSAAGYFSSNNDFNLIKIDSEGIVLWTKVYGGDQYDFPNSVKQNNEGGYIITGTTESFGAGDLDVYLIKTKANGDTLWTKTFGRSGRDWGYDVLQTNDGGYIVSGVTYFSGRVGLYLIKTNDNGDTLWTKAYNGISEGESIQQTTDGGYIITGNFLNASSYVDIYLVKTDAMGDTLWTKVFGGTDFDDGCCVKQTRDGGYIVAGRTTNYGAGGEDICLIKTDANGDLNWYKTYGGSGDEGYSPDVEQTNDGGFILSGNTNSFGAGNSDAYLVKTDSIGDVIWSKTFGGTGIDECFSVCQSNDGGYLAVGGTWSFGLSSNYNLYIIKTDSLGNNNCNQSSPATITTTPTIQTVDSIRIMITSTNTIVTSPPTNVITGGVAMTLCTSVGIDESAADLNNIEVFPNPSIGSFQVAFNSSISKGSIEIYNLIGEIVFSEVIISETKKIIDLKNAVEGIYFVKVIDGDKNYCKKIIIE